MTVTVEELDHLIIEELGIRQLKTVRILWRAQEKTNLKLEEIADRIYQLVNIGTLEGFGNLRHWHHSELRMPRNE